MRSVSIRKEDQVLVIGGRDKGRQGRVLRVEVAAGRALVEGVNKIKRHTKPNPGKGSKGGVVEREATLHVSNLLLVCPECGKPTRVGRKTAENGRRLRTCKKCRAVVDKKASS
jgi:large subunit ribosomal protein L24